MILNLSKIEVSDFLEPGIHVVTIKECVEKTSFERKSLRFTFVNAEDLRVYHSILLTDKTKRVLASLARACGFTDEEMHRVTPEIFLGRTLRVVVEMNENDYPCVTRWMPVKNIDADPTKH